MRLRGDDRAVTVQVGAVLLLGILVISLSIFQATVVPNENEQVEFQHNQVLQEDMQSFRSAVTRAGGAGLTQSVAVRLGTQYPERALFINPPPPTGTLQTRASSDIEIRNARALDDETDDYWTGTDDRAFETSSVRYSPSYNVYQNAPTTVYEGSVLYNRFDGGTTVAQSQQSVVDGRTISLVAVDGELSRSQLGAVAVDVRPKSVSQRTVTVEGDGEAVSVVVPSSLDPSVWRNNLLVDEYDDPSTPDDPDKYVAEVNAAGPDAVELVFETGTQYNLNLAKVGVGTGVSDTTATYLTAVSGDGDTVAEGSTQQLVVEARDEFNNPISGQQVTASVAGGDPGNVVGSPATTDSDGQAVFTYTAPTDVDGERSVTVTAQFGGSPEQQAEFDLSVADSDGSGGGADDINPNGEDAVILNDAGIVLDACSGGRSRQGSTNCRVDVQLENLDTTNTRNVTDIRFNFYDLDATSNNPPPAPQSAELVRSGYSNVQLKAANSGGKYQPINPSISINGGASEILNFRFYADRDTTTPFDVEQGDFFVFSILFEDGGAATYFVAPDEGGLSGPVANTGANFGVDEGSTGTLNGSGSTTDSGSTYEWRITDANGVSGVTISDADTSTPGATFDATGASVSSDTPVTVQLTVTNSSGVSDTDTVQVTVRDTGGGGGGTQTYYPDQSRDQNGGASIPPSNPQGVLSDFSQMQTDNNQFAQFQPSSKETEIGVATTGVDTTASTYELEVRHSYDNGASAATLQIVDSSGAVLQSQSLTPTGSTATTSITLNTQATNYVQNNGQLYVVYTKSNDNKVLYVYYQRLLAS